MHHPISKGQHEMHFSTRKLVSSIVTHLNEDHIATFSHISQFTVLTIYDTLENILGFFILIIIHVKFTEFYCVKMILERRSMFLFCSSLLILLSVYELMRTIRKIKYFQYGTIIRTNQ